MHRSEKLDFIAHIRESDKAIQTVEEHLLGVQQLAELYGRKIGVKHIAGLAGLLHDMGKFTQQFRDYIVHAVNNPDKPPKRGSVDHSTAGGKLLYERYHTGVLSQYPCLLAEVVGNAIISHHSYLQDYLGPDLTSDYLRRVRDKKSADIGYEDAKSNFFERTISEYQFQIYVEQAATELAAFLDKNSTETFESKIMFLTKYIFSALIDADRTNTREFEDGSVAAQEHLRKNIKREEQKELFADYYKKLQQHIDGFQKRSDAGTLINLLRREMSDNCDKFAGKPTGIYTLSIPTGGGKTLASFRYALKHAIEHGKNRIIYVVPYTTIIEQNAEELRKIIKDDANLLEHHSNVIEDETDDDEYLEGRTDTAQKLKLAKDNWNSPIIFTTMVQFLNVFYASGSRNIRRLHNLSDAIIIFDEVQKVPVSCVSLFNRALNLLKEYASTTVVLCTATQPALDFVEHKLKINADAEMVSNMTKVAEAFKRVEMVDLTVSESFSNESLTEFVEDKLEELQSVLVILNTKSVVRKLFESLSGGAVPVYHLSTAMCPAHRSEILEIVKKHLDKKEKVVCISTPLIEAGVDISFHCVIRSLAGLDSVAQAAGRCNRHGEYGLQQVYVIDHAEENLKHLPEISAGKKLAKQILVDLQMDEGQHGGHMLSNQAMERYFQKFYKQFESTLNYSISKLRRDMTTLLFANKKESDSYYQAYFHTYKVPLPLFLTSSYNTAAAHFEVIDSHNTSVIVPYEVKGKEIIAQLNGSETIENLSRLLREAQLYTINLLRYEKDKLSQNGGLESLLDGKLLVLTEGAYNKEYGLNVENDSALSHMIF